MRASFAVLVDHSQFFVEDAEGADLGAWNLDATYTQLERDHLAVKPGGLVVATACQYGPVLVEIELRSGPPDDALDGWDHAAEAGLAVRSGRVVVFAPEGTGNPDPPSVAVPPGSYRVLVLYGDLDSLPDGDSREGHERYRIGLWPGDDPAVVVHKRGFWCCREGRHGGL